jgi:hypothetical protein
MVVLYNCDVRGGSIFNSLANVSRQCILKMAPQLGGRRLDMEARFTGTPRSLSRVEDLMKCAWAVAALVGTVGMLGAGSARADDSGHCG